MAIKTMEDLKKAIDRVTEYSWGSELEDYMHHEGDKSHHIFHTLVDLDNWVSRRDTTARAYVLAERKAHKRGVR